jgi:hypothetical protein
MAKGVGEGDALKEVDRVQREADSMSDGGSSDEDGERPQPKPEGQEEADRVQREADPGDDMATSSDDDEPMEIGPDLGAAAADPIPGPKKPEALDIPFPRWMAEQQRADPFLHGLITKLEGKIDAASADHPADADDGKYEFMGASKILTTKVRIKSSGRTFTEHQAIMVPRTAVTAVLEMYHGNGAVHNHNGRHKTIMMIRRRFTWPALYSDVDKWVKSCQTCMERKRVVLKHARYHFSTNVQGAFERLCIDFVGPLTTTKRKNSYILTLMCPFSRWPQAYAVSRATAVKAIDCLQKSIATFGAPSQLLSDRGFLSEELRAFLSSQGIKHIKTAAYTPSTNGSIEGFHKYLAQALYSRVNAKHSDWDEFLDDVLLAYRTAPIDGTNLTPFEIIFGRPANLPVDNALAAEEEAAKKEAPLTPQEYSERVAEATRNHAETIRSVQGERHARNQRQDLGVPHREEYEKGQQVFLRFPPGTFRFEGGTTKFSKVNNGPYTILRKITTDSGSVVYEVQHNTTEHRSRVGPSRIIPYQRWEEPAGTTRPRELPGSYQKPKKCKEAAKELETTAHEGRERKPTQNDKPEQAAAPDAGTEDRDTPMSDAMNTTARRASSTARPTEKPHPDEEKHKEGSRALKEAFPPTEGISDRAARRMRAADPQPKKEDAYAKQHTTTAAQRRRRSPPKSRAIHNMRDYMEGIWEPYAHPGANR